MTDEEKKKSDGRSMTDAYRALRNTGYPGSFMFFFFSFGYMYVRWVH